VGVFVDEDPAAVLEIVKNTGITAIQLHGNESPQYCKALPLKIIKAFSVKNDFDASVLQSYPVRGYLLDTWDENVRGGSGRVFDWSIAARAAQTYPNIILAGGLGPTNVIEALESVHPYAIDVNSGVEIRPGNKNYMKMQELVGLVRNWAR
jgi:phosphoribosylanthranilate isomerase